MTRSGGNNDELTVVEANKIADAIGPKMREGFRSELSRQTGEIQSIVDAHEVSDNERFSTIDAKLGRLDKFVWTAAGAASVITIVITIIAPLVVAFLKRKLNLP